MITASVMKELSKFVSERGLYVRSRSNRLEVFCEKGVLKNYAIFTGKHLCWSFFLIKLQTMKLLFNKFQVISFLNSCSHTIGNLSYNVLRTFRVGRVNPVLLG